MLNDLFRPKKLSEVCGQSFVVDTLQNKLNTNTVPHAMLFVGHAGCSKTTLARIMSKETNSHTLEFDAASNNSVEAVRCVINNCRVKPLGYSNHFVIIDEPQRFSKQSWDTLLKTIEEPPSFVYFAFCTTEEDKIPSTIKSRCETFRINPIAESDIFDRLMFICNTQKFNYQEDALQIIAKNSDNSMRQAISNLELASASQPITAKLVCDKLFKFTYNTMMNIIYSYLDKDYNTLIDTIYNLDNAGKFSQELFTFILDLNIYFKTKKFSLTKIPEPMYNSIKELNKSEQDIIKSMMDKLYELQLEARNNNPIIKELMIASLLRGSSC